MNPPSSSEPIWGPPYDLHYTQGTSHEIPYPDHGILQRSSVVFPSSQNLQMMLLQQSQQSQNRPTLSLLHQNGILGDHRSFPSFPWDSSGNYEFLSGNYVKREDQALQLHMNHPQQYNEWIHGRIGLNLGGRTYFSAEDSYLARFGKRSRLSGAPIHVPHCQAEGCTADLSKAKHYHRRHKVCELHSKAPTVVANGQTQRFCQQCSRFHALSEFDDSKRSCRKRLADHNRRRRKPQAISAKPESSHDASEAAPSSDTKPALVLKANSSPSREDSEASKGSSAKKTQTEDNHPVNKHNQTVNSTLNPGDQQDNRGLTSNYNVINTNPTKLSLFSDKSGGLAKVNNNSIEQCSWLKSATTNSPNIRPVTKSQNFHDLISCTSGSRINTSFSANPSTNLSGSYLGHHHQQEQLGQGDDHGRNALIFNENHGRLQRNYATQNHGECDDDSSNRQPKYQDMQSLRSFYASTGSLL